MWLLRQKMMRSIKTQLILFLLCLALLLAFRDREGVFLVTTLVAVLSCLAAESFLAYLKTKTFRLAESPVITGLIIGFVLASDEPLWKFAAASIFAILSKHLIRFQNKHIFNPAGLGIFLTLLLGAQTQWKGTYLWQALLPFGLYFSWKIKKTEILLGYALVSLVLFGLQAASQKAPLWQVFGYLSYFYIFVMLIEPKTSPLKPTGKYLFGAGAALLIFALTEIGARFDVELASLLAMNMAVPLLNRFTTRKGMG
jgi:enediyne biosynthesis protein E5